MALAPRCGPLQTIRIFAPEAGRIEIAPPSVVVAGAIGRNFEPATFAVEVDGVDLVAALGLVAPFVDASGAVSIGPDGVSVTGFTYDPTQPGTPTFALELQGLPSGDHQLSVSAVKAPAGTPVVRTRTFGLAAGFDQVLAATPSAGSPGGPILLGSSGAIANQSVGEAVAAAPISLGAAGSLRSGHVEAAEQRIAVGGP